MPQSLVGINSQQFPVAANNTGAATSGGGTGTGAAAAATTGAVASALTNSAVPGATGAMITLGHLSRHFDLRSTIRALEQNEGARLLARPNIMAYDNEEAEFQSVQEIPVQSLVQTSQGGSIGTTEFREAGIILTVTPRIMSDGTILMQVTPEFSTLSGFSSTGQPIFDTRRVTTMLHLRDGEPAAIGGMVRRNELETTRGMPKVNKMKYFGKLFSNHDTEIRESELVVFIQAEIVEVGFQGDLREQMAKTTVDQMVGQMPLPSPAPVVDCCNDANCPIHFPRTRGGSEYVAPVDPHIHPPAHEGEIPAPQYEPVPATPEAAHGPPLPGPELTPHEARGRQPQQPAAVPRMPADPHMPPPVIFEETASLQPRRQPVMSRLPSVHPQPSGLSSGPTVVTASPHRDYTPVAQMPSPARTANGSAAPVATEPASQNRQNPAQQSWLDKMFKR